MFRHRIQNVLFFKLEVALTWKTMGEFRLMNSAPGGCFYLEFNSR
jgi:hypothetical protein